MRTAFVYWEDRIAPVFDTARWIYIVEIDSGKILDERKATIAGETSIQKALELVNLEVKTLVCGAISGALQDTIVAYGIRVIPFVAGDLREVVYALVHGRLQDASFRMPGCSGRGRGRRLRGRQKDNPEQNVMNKKAGRKDRTGFGQGSCRPGGYGDDRPWGGSPDFCVCPECGQKEI